MARAVRTCRVYLVLAGAIYGRAMMRDSETLFDYLFHRAESHAVSAQELAAVAKMEAEVEAAPDVDRAIFNGRHSASIHLLNGYALELYLKCAILLSGGDKKDVLKAGHDLKMGLRMAKERGFDLNDKELEWVVESVAPSHVTHQFRYGGQATMELPPLEVTFRTIDALRDEVGEQHYGNPRGAN